MYADYVYIFFIIGKPLPKTYMYKRANKKAFPYLPIPK